VLWRKLEVWAKEVRVDFENPHAFEWFQWLAEILESLRGDSPTPAYEAHKDWKPTRLTQEL
jgi:hypothetical protein